MPQKGAGVCHNQVAPIVPTGMESPGPRPVPTLGSVGIVAVDLPATVLFPNKLLLTVRECAGLTSLSQKSILRLIQRGKLKCVSGIRHKKIPVVELHRFIRDNLS